MGFLPPVEMTFWSCATVSTGRQACLQRVLPNYFVVISTGGRNLRPEGEISFVENLKDFSVEDSFEMTSGSCATDSAARQVEILD